MLHLGFQGSIKERSFFFPFLTFLGFFRVFGEIFRFSGVPILLNSLLEILPYGRWAGERRTYGW